MKTAVPVLAALFLACLSMRAQGQDASTTPEPAPNVLTLTCTGGGTAAKTDAGLAYGASSAGRNEKYRGFEGEIELRLFSDDDRIRLPTVILPAGRGGKTEWFKIRKLESSDREIIGRIETSRIGVHLPNASRFRLDRSSGALEIRMSSSGFSGVCSKSDPLAKKF